MEALINDGGYLSNRVPAASKESFSSDFFDTYYGLSSHCLARDRRLYY